MGALAEDEVMISTQARNFPAVTDTPRPVTSWLPRSPVAASALTGKITDPRTLEDQMSQTIAEKILAAKAGVDRVTPGQIVDAYPDLVMSHTATWRSVSVMKKIGAKRLYDPNRLAIVLDHISPAKTEKYAADQQTSRNFARGHGSRSSTDVDAGIAHLVLMEHGHVKPGDLIVGTDSHCTIYASAGSVGIGDRLHGSRFRVGDRQAVDEGADHHQTDPDRPLRRRASARRT